MALIPKLFGDMLAPSGLSDETKGMVNARVDWKETPEAHVLKVDLPGLTKEGVKVEVGDGRFLASRGERAAVQEDK